MIKVKNLSKTFYVTPKSPGLMASLKNLISGTREARVALHPVSFELERGEFVGLIGANGAGKTTLVKMLSGIVTPTQGDLSVAGFIPHHRPIGFQQKLALVMGQKAGLWWDLPAMDCFMLLKEIYQIEQKDLEMRVGELKEILGVGHVLTTPIRNLSLGERMKMELMASLLHRPEIIFLDEPTIGLDIVSQKKMRSFLREYSQKYRPLIILTSHYMEDIDELCKRTMILKRGSMVYDGPLEELKKRMGQKRVLRIHLSEDLKEFPAIENMSSVKRINQFEWDIHFPKEMASQVSSQVLQKLKVADFSYVREDLGEVIEKVFSQEGDLSV